MNVAKDCSNKSIMNKFPPITPITLRNYSSAVDAQTVTIAEISLTRFWITPLNNPSVRCTQCSLQYLRPAILTSRILNIDVQYVQPSSLAIPQHQLYACVCVQSSCFASLDIDVCVCDPHVS